MKALSLVLFLFALIIAPIHARNIVIIGDSLSAGYGIDAQKGWVNLLSAKLKGTDYQIINLSVSGSTSSNGLMKLTSALKKYKPDILIIELGANDGLRGLPVSQLKENLETMIKEAQQSDAKVLLLATYLPPNYGTRFLGEFNNTYKVLAQNYKVPLVSMFLDGVAGHNDLMQNDGLHPNEKAQPLILENVWPHLKPLLVQGP